MPQRGRTSFLRSTDLLSQVPVTQLEQLAERMSEVTAKPGEVLFREGEVGDAVYFVVDGVVRIERAGVELVNMRPGDCVGEFALIDDGPRSGSAMADTDVTLLKWERRDFHSALGLNPEVTTGIFLSLTRKLRRDLSAQLLVSLERERWQQELTRAREIQRAMLPTSDYSSPQLEIAGFCRTAEDVGGDYYDYLSLDENRMALILADVMGHGLFSGLLVAMAKSCLHTQVAFDASPSALMGAMHRTVLHSVRAGMLMSCCYFVLDLRLGTLTYANAGHPFPYHYRRREDRVDQLPSMDMLLGAHESHDPPFSTASTEWRTGDLLVLYSDGITEAENGRDELFGEARLEELVRESRDLSAPEVRNLILDTVTRHCDGRPSGDDVTLVVARAP